MTGRETKSLGRALEGKKLRINWLRGPLVGQHSLKVAYVGSIPTGAVLLPSTDDKLARFNVREMHPKSSEPPCPTNRFVLLDRRASVLPVQDLSFLLQSGHAVGPSSIASMRWRHHR